MFSLPRFFRRVAPILAMATLLTVATPAATALAADNTPVRLPTTRYFKENLVVSGDRLVWQDTRRDMNTLQQPTLYQYDMKTHAESAVTTLTSDQYTPDVSGDVLVWRDEDSAWRTTGGRVERNILGKNLATGEVFPVCTAPGVQQQPRVSGNVVVWEDYRSGSLTTGGDIYGFDLTTRTEFPICTDPGNQRQPDISGDWVVWMDESHGAGGDIVAYNLKTKVRVAVCSAPGVQDDPQVAGAVVVWQDARNGNQDIYGYDLVARHEFPVATSAGTEDNPSVSGDVVTWKARSVDYKSNWVSGFDVQGRSPFTIVAPGTGWSSNAVALSEGNVAWLRLDPRTPQTDILLSHVTEVDSVEGANAYDTAVAASVRSFPAKADTVVIAAASAWPDALGGAGLAASRNAPFLVVNRDWVPAHVAAEIKRLGATHAVILGGDAVVSEAVSDGLTDLLGPGSVERLAGADLYATARLAAAATVAGKGATWDGTAFVATGRTYADSLAAAAISARKGWPLYLSNSAWIPKTTLAAMRSAGVKRVVMLGGTSALAPGVEGSLRATFGSSAVIRLQGATRYGTAAAVTTYAVGRGFFSWHDLSLTTGESFNEGLCSGMLQKRDGPLLLSSTRALPAETAATLSAKRKLVARVTYIGTTGAVWRSVRAAVRGIVR